MRIPLIPFVLLATLIFIFSCGKTGSKPSAPVPPNDTIPNTNPPAPAKVDSLYSWQKADSLGGHGIEDIWFTSTSKGYILGDDAFIYQSLDGGLSWSKVGSSGFIMLNLFFVDDQYGFVQGGSSIQVTKDGGNTWSSKTLQGGGGTAMNVFFSSRSTGYVSDAGSHLYKTTDTGNTWQLAHTPIPAGSFTNYVYFFNDEEGYIFSGNGIFSKTTDGGITWLQVNQAVAGNIPNSPPYNSLQFLDSLTGYYASTSGISKTIDGGAHWNSVYPKGAQVSVLKFFSPTTGYYKADSAIYKTVDGGQSWTTSCKLAADFLTGMHFVDSTHGWACTSKGYVLRMGP